MGAIVIMLLAACILHPPSYVYRVLFWQDASYDDFKRMDFAPIEKAKTPFYFASAGSEKQLEFENRFNSGHKLGTIEEFLKQTKTYAFLVIRNDTLLYENYLEEFTAQDLQTTFSASKSVLSMLVGIAIDESKISGLDAPVTDYLPELLEKDSDFARITIGDLLRMRSGLAYERGIRFPLLNCDDPLTYYHTDLRKAALKYSRIEAAPDKAFKYNNYNPLLIGMVLERATETSVSEYLEQKLWKPIGSSYDASWSTDNNSFEKMESGFNTRPIDFAKLGSLILNGGSWNGQQLISSEWLTKSTRPSDTLVFCSGQRWGYSHFWWQVIVEGQADDIFANGRFGQFLYISPANNTIIVRHGLQTENFDDDNWTALFKIYLNQR